MRRVRIYDLLVQMLRGLPGQLPEPYPRLSDIVAALGPRSFGIALVLFGLPNLLPVPGLPILCGLIIGVIAFQMVIGKESLVLPRWIGNRRIKREDLDTVVRRAEPSLRLLERAMRPRLAVFTTDLAQWGVGAVLLLLALALMAPIPFFGGVLPGIAVTLFGLALVERDGLFVAFGLVATLLALMVTGWLTHAILKSLISVFL